MPRYKTQRRRCYTASLETSKPSNVSPFSGRKGEGQCRKSVIIVFQSIQSKLKCLTLRVRIYHDWKLAQHVKKKHINSVSVVQLWSIGRNFFDMATRRLPFSKLHNGLDEKVLMCILTNAVTIVHKKYPIFTYYAMKWNKVSYHLNRLGCDYIAKWKAFYTSVTRIPQFWAIDGQGRFAGKT